MLPAQYLFDIEPYTKINKRDYLLIIPPDRDVVSKIMYFKLKAWEMIGAYPSLHSTAHITINHDYNIYASVFEEKLTYYRRKVSFINTFEVKISGFDKFQHGDTYTIYAKVEVSAAIKETLSKFNKTFSKGVVKTPHITIAKTITKEKFEILWKYFEHLNFEYSFYPDKIRVLETPTRRFFNQPMKMKTELKLKQVG
ncbi:2'-5' RNA ligase family protein [Mucilaginibacter arboris]|uniref:2'-5' RNA ligase n=1 Tax=Mucilaginibacter arboris TaxID=2682090 RepID=A0A7K1STX4_9SPHI|nr:2'-5' RNA ligase family protein [Mucilaginibacter arboris]MVN20713.1 hypothetical protein [Mucilaginibacter arboris]